MCQCRVAWPKALGRGTFPSSGTRIHVGSVERQAPLPVYGLIGPVALASHEEAAGKSDYCRDLPCNLADQTRLGRSVVWNKALVDWIPTSCFSSPKSEYCEVESVFGVAVLVYIIQVSQL